MLKTSKKDKKTPFKLLELQPSSSKNYKPLMLTLMMNLQLWLNLTNQELLTLSWLQFKLPLLSLKTLLTTLFKKWKTQLPLSKPLLKMTKRTKEIPKLNTKPQPKKSSKLEKMFNKLKLMPKPNLNKPEPPQKSKKRSTNNKLTNSYKLMTTRLLKKPNVKNGEENGLKTLPKEKKKSKSLKKLKLSLPPNQIP